MPRRRRRLTEKRKPKRPASLDGEWWTIRKIVDERSVKGKVQYLVDWDDNRDTGEAYPPSWVPASDVLDDAIEEWKDKNNTPQAEEAPSQVAPDDEPDSEDSQPPRPANYRNLQRSSTSVQRKRLHSEGDEDEDQVAPGKRARIETASPSLEPVPSITSSASLESAYEEPPAQRPLQNISVELRKDPGFDSSEYLSVHGSQSTAAYSSQPLSELETQDQRVAIVSYPSQATIPDSQDPSSLATVESQRRETQNSTVSNPAIIPDSQDLGGEESSSRKPSSHPHTSEFSGPGTNHFIPASTVLEEDIPSRQPGPYRSVGSSDLSAGKTNSQGTGYGSNRAASTEASLHPLRQTESEPVFYTQPNLNAASPAPQSLQDTHTQERTEDRPSGEPAVEYQKSPRLGEIVESGSGSAQAAQVVDRPYEPSQNQFLESHSESIERPPLLPVLEREEPHPDSGSRRESPSQHSAKELLQSAPQAWNWGKHPSQHEMFAEREDESNSADRPTSTARRLQGLWDEAPTRSAEQAPNTEGHSSAAAELAALSASEAQDDCSREPQHTSPAAYFTQPLQQAESWGPQTTGEQDASRIPGSPGSANNAPQGSAIDSIQGFVNQAFGTRDEPSSSVLMPPPSFAMQQRTVSPADVSKPMDAEKTLALLPSLSEAVSSGPYEGSGNSITMGQAPQTQEDSPESSDQEPTSMDHLVTLPFQASIRDLYYQTLLEYKQEAIDFGEAFSSETYNPPQDSLVKSIDELFNRLQNLCDYPEDLLGTSIEKLPTKEKTKYTSSANAKFNFILELLQEIKVDTKVLIIARSLNLLRPLVELVETLELDCTCDALNHVPEDAIRNSPVRVTLSLPDTIDPSRFDVIVGYDSAFASSAISADLEAKDFATTDEKRPLVLRLATAFSIEHINVELPGPFESDLERKNALLSGVARARMVIRDPPQLPEPYEVAKLFAEHLNDQIETIDWEPYPMPDHVLDVYAHSQSLSQGPEGSPMDGNNGRKRKLDEEEDDAESKRMRRFSRPEPMSEVTAPPLTTAVRALLNRAGFKDASSNEAQISVPLSVLEALVTNMAEAERAAEANNLEAEYKRVIEQLDSRVKEHEASTEEIYEKYRTALQDRTQFESEARKADAALQAKSEEMQRVETKNAATIEELESRITRLTSDAASGSLGATENALQETGEKVRVLEKQLQNARGEKEYVMEQYQNANSATSAMRAEIDELREQNETLKHRASDNLRNIHEIQKKNTARDLTLKIAGLETQLKEREIELDRVREELRQAKNGRRETRQVSVPRSPRMGIMSPRAPPRAGVSGSASRGASPGPVMGGFDTPGAASAAPGLPAVQFTNTQSGNGRWNPLR